MKKTGVVVGMLTALLFSAGVMAANDPQSGRFSFQARTPEPKDHFINLRVQFEGGMPNSSGGNQALGVNVYWKTKDKNQLQGRKFYNSLQPNMPRPGQNFSDTHPEGKVYRYEGNHEHIEWLVWEGVNMDYDFKNGCPPTAGNTSTRFYYHRFKNYTEQFSGGFSCTTLAVPQPKQEDMDVAMSSFAVTYMDNICNRMGEYCLGYKMNSSRTLSKDVYIPSYKLEYVVVEVFGFEYKNNAGRAGQSFYTMAVEALKFTPSNEPGKPGKMNLLRGDRDAGGEFSAFGVSGYSKGSTGDIRGYYNAQDSHYYQNEEKTAACGQFSTDPCTYDFTDLDTLILSLQYTDPRKIPKWEHPFSRGIIFTLEPKYFTWNCQEDRNQCNFPLRK